MPTDKVALTLAELVPSGVTLGGGGISGVALGGGAFNIAPDGGIFDRTLAVIDFAEHCKVMMDLMGRDGGFSFSGC